MRRVSALLLLLPLVAGCALFEGDPAPTVVTGAVVDAESDAPVAGIQVLLSQGGGGFGAYPTRDRDVTDAEGRFEVRYTTGDPNALLVFVNACAYADPLPDCYDARYASPTKSVLPERRHEVRYALTPTAP